MTCQLLETRLKHKIKTLLLSPLPPQPLKTNTHTHKSHQGSKRQTVKGSLSLLHGLCDRRGPPGLSALSKNRVAQLCWPQSMKDARRGVSRAGQRQALRRRAWDKPGAHGPPPACAPSLLFLSVALWLTLSVSCLCAFMCAQKARFRVPGQLVGMVAAHPILSLRLTGIGS